MSKPSKSPPQFTIPLGEVVELRFSLFERIKLLFYGRLVLQISEYPDLESLARMSVEDLDQEDNQDISDAQESLNEYYARQQRDPPSVIEEGLRLRAILKPANKWMN